MKALHHLIETMPKTDLHCHFDGSIRVSTLITLAKKNKVALFSYEPEPLMEHMKYGAVRHSLEEYLRGFPPLIAVLQHAEDIEQAFFEVCQDAHRENVWHLELRYCPYLHIKQGLSCDDVVKACLRGGEKAEREFGMSVKHILCGLKNDSIESVLDIARLASIYRDHGVVAFDLAGPEKGFPIKTHQPAIKLAKENNLFITIHAGESCGPESIYEAIHEGFANRIGHGTSLLKDQALLSYVVRNNIGIEACPLSNLHTGAILSITDHPLKQMLKNRLQVSINTDNRLCSDTTITKEILTVISSLQLNLEEIKALLANGFATAFLADKDKQFFLKRFEAAWADLMKDFSPKPSLFSW
jgi:adenosine deaminase